MFNEDGTWITEPADVPPNPWEAHLPNDA